VKNLFDKSSPVKKKAKNKNKKLTDNEKYVGVVVTSKRKAYQCDAYANEGIDFSKAIIAKTNRKNFGKGCENELVFQFENQVNDFWYPAKHFKKVK
jgi:hypothetical protein